MKPNGKPTAAQLAALSGAKQSIACNDGRPYLPARFEARSFEALERKGLVRVEVLRTATSQHAGYVLNDSGEKALAEWLRSLSPIGTVTP